MVKEQQFSANIMSQNSETSEEYAEVNLVQPPIRRTSLPNTLAGYLELTGDRLKHLGHTLSSEPGQIYKNYTMNL